MEAMLQEMERLAETVAREHEESEVIHREEKSAKARLLARVVKLLTPSVRAVGTRPIIKRTTLNGLRTEVRYLPLSDTRFEPKKNISMDTFEGSVLALGEAGHLARFSYHGRGSSEVVMSTYADSLQAVEEWPDIEAYIANALTALTKAEGSRTNANNRARENTAKLKAVLELLG